MTTTTDLAELIRAKIKGQISAPEFAALIDAAQRLHDDVEARLSAALGQAEASRVADAAALCRVPELRERLRSRTGC
jgi:hypothetical protein